MNLLAFDTALDKTYITLLKSDEVFSEIIENKNNNYHSAYLISGIANIFKKAGITPKDLDAIATNIGPGSFTGIRACMTVAKVMAQQLNLKTVGISSLEILSKLNKTEKETLVILDAKKSMAYTYQDKLLGALTLDEVSKIINENDFFIISDEALKIKLPDFTSKMNSYTDMNEDSGKILASIAKEKIMNNNYGDYKDLKPLYIQPPPGT